MSSTDGKKKDIFIAGKTNEDIFIARSELDKKIKRIKQKKSKKAKEEKEHLEICHMRCPKCGSQLVEIKFREVMIDKCAGCQGVWMDANELSLIKTTEGGFLNSMLKILN